MANRDDYWRDRYDRPYRGEYRNEEREDYERGRQRLANSGADRERDSDEYRGGGRYPRRGEWSVSARDRDDYDEMGSNYGGYGASTGYAARAFEGDYNDNRDWDYRTRERSRDREGRPGNFSDGGFGRATGNTFGASFWDGETGRPRPRTRGRFAGRGPKGWRRSDERIMEEINERLARDGAIDASDVEVRVNNGIVTLTGVVDDRDAKHGAEDVAEEVFGVEDVQNQLKVRHGFWSHFTGEHADEDDEREVTRRPADERASAARPPVAGSTSRRTSAQTSQR